jgi:hypothetical protein
VYVKSQNSHRLKAMLGARDQLVRAKRALGNQVRGLLRPFGIRLPSRQGTKKFAEAAHQAVRRDNMLHASVTALLEALAAIEGQIARLDEQLKELVRRSPVSWGEAGPDGRARDMLVASRTILLRLIQCCRPLEQWTSERTLADTSVPVTTTNHLTQQPHVKNQRTETLTEFWYKYPLLFP